MTAPETLYSVIVPVYNNEPTIMDLFLRLNHLSELLEHKLQVVFVVDGSTDNSYKRIKEHIPTSRFCAEVIQLSRNFGSYNAIRMGLATAHGPFFATMAADLQEPVELCLQFFRAMYEKEADIVIGQRIARDDLASSRLLSGCFWAVYRRFVQSAMPKGGIDMFGCTTQVRDALMQLDETNSSLPGQVIWLGFRRKNIPYVRTARTSGTSGWSLAKKIRYMLDSIFSFTDLPIIILLLTGALGLTVSLTFGAFVIIMRLLGYIKIAGYTPILLSIVFSASLILFGLGIVGMYVWRAFENTKHRPLFIPMTHEHFPYEQ